VYNSFLSPKAYFAFSIALPLSSFFSSYLISFGDLVSYSLSTLYLPMEEKKILIESILEGYN
jgi:hypothetical protein